MHALAERNIDVKAETALSSKPLLVVDDLTVQFGGANAVRAVENLSISFNEGEFVTIVGPSGCGKSTLLSVIDGLLPAHAGRVLLRDKVIKSPGPDRAMVFQDAALLPWRTVLSNIEFGLQMRGGTRKAERTSTARRYLAKVGLSRFAQHYPHQLSGGMRQRVGIARALAVNPDILLMDEPFGALDAQTRELLGTELLRIWDQERKTVLFVTHSIEEAIYLGDRVIVLTGRPARVKAEIVIDLPRPRGDELRADSRFMHYRMQIWNLLDISIDSDEDS